MMKAAKKACGTAGCRARRRSQASAALGPGVLEECNVATAARPGRPPVVSPTLALLAANDLLQWRKVSPREQRLLTSPKQTMDHIQALQATMVGNKCQLHKLLTHLTNQRGMVKRTVKPKLQLTPAQYKAHQLYVLCVIKWSPEQLDSTV